MNIQRQSRLEFANEVKESRLRWFGDVKRRDAGKRTTAWQEEEEKWTQEERFMDAVREDMQVVSVAKEDADDRKRWKCKIYCRDGNWTAERRRTIFCHQSSYYFVSFCVSSL